MKKRVNINPQGHPITALPLMIRSNVLGIMLDTEDIKKVILQKGSVDEVLPDGTTVSLNLTNYDDTSMYEKIVADRAAKEADVKKAEAEAAREQAIIDKKEKEKQDAINALNKQNTQPQTEQKPEVKVETEVKADTKVEEKKEAPQSDEDAAVKAAREKIEKEKQGSSKK